MRILKTVECVSSATKGVVVGLFNHLRYSMKLFSLQSSEIFRKKHSDKNRRLICPLAVNPRAEGRGGEGLDVGLK